MANLNPVEVNIRASWAINCAVALGDIAVTLSAAEKEKIIYLRAKMFLGLLDKVKAVIQPPMQPIVGKSRAEKKDIAKDEFIGDIEIE